MDDWIRFDHTPEQALTEYERAIIATYAPANGGYGPPRAVEAARRLHREEEERRW